MSIQPLGDRVLVQEIEVKEVSVGGIILPDSAKEKPQEAKVVALGTAASIATVKKSLSTLPKATQ